MQIRTQSPLSSANQAVPRSQFQSERFLSLIGQYHQARNAAGTPSGQRALVLAAAALNAAKASVPRELWALIDRPTSCGLAQ